VWKFTWTLIKDASHQASPANIPNSVDPAVPSEWRLSSSVLYDLSNGEAIVS
jgi:hypothetical protein